MKYYPQINFGIDQIEALDKLFGGNHQEVVFNIQNDSFFSAYGVYKLITTKYNTWIHNKRREIEKKKENLKKVLGKEKLEKEDLTDNILNLESDIYLVRNFLNDLKTIITYRKTIKIKEDKKAKRQSSDEEEIILTPKQNSIYNSLLRGKPQKYGYEDFNQVLKYYFRVSSYEELKQNGLEYTHTFVEMALNVKSRRAYEDIMFMRNQIQKRVSLIRKNMKNNEISPYQEEEIKLLKSFLKILKEIILKFDNHEKKSHNYLFDIIDFWLTDEKNEYYLLELFNTNPKMVNLKNDLTLAEYVADKFCLACKMYLINHGGDKNKEYYLRILNSILNNPEYDHAHDDIIEVRINTLKQFVQRGKFKNDRKSEIYNLIQKLGVEEEKIKPLKEVSIEEFLEQKAYIKDYYYSATNDSNRMNLSSADTLIVNSESYPSICYTLDYTKDGSTLIKIHVLDIESLIPSDTPIDAYFINSNRLPNDICDSMKLEVGKTSPVITYQLNMNPNGAIYNFKVYKSVVKPNMMSDTTTDYDIVKKDDDIKPYIQSAKKLAEFYNLENDHSTFGSVVTDNYHELLNRTIGRDLKEKDMPFVYKVQSPPDQVEFARQLTGINWFLFRISDDDFKTIYHIICNKNNTIGHYSNKDIGHYGLNSQYVTEINKPFTYMGLMAQKILSDVFIKEINHGDMVKEYDELLVELINYYNEVNFSYKKKVKVPNRTKQKTFTKS